MTFAYSIMASDLKLYEYNPIPRNKVCSKTLLN
jgi:hypothetical protein